MLIVRKTSTASCMLLLPSSPQRTVGPPDVRVRDRPPTCSEVAFDYLRHVRGGGCPYDPIDGADAEKGETPWARSWWRSTGRTARVRRSDSPGRKRVSATRVCGPSRRGACL